MKLAGMNDMAKMTLMAISTLRAPAHLQTQLISCRDVAQKDFFPSDWHLPAEDTAVTSVLVKFTKCFRRHLTRHRPGLVFHRLVSSN